MKASDRLVPPLPRQQRLRTVILGAGIAGRLVVEELHRHKRLGYVPVGFLDDDPRKQRRTIAGLPVWGALKDLPAIAQEQQLQLALLAIPSAAGALHKRMAQLAQQAGLELRVVPGIYAVLQQDTEAGRVRPVQIEDFYRRAPVPFNLDALNQTLKDKTVLITGAAGSIGQELCRQVARFSPRELVLYDYEESNLFATTLALRQSHPSLPLQVILGDVRDQKRVRSILTKYRPDVLYHAAAYKHVPMMEMHPLEAIKTNVLGTAVLIEEVRACKVGKFVLISTDKAVNPSSVMGACKRVAELITQSAAQRPGPTAFMVVRFGNVMASRGNVIERFQEQIATGGPLTVTHAKMTRYLMSREEAAQLVMQASALGKGGELFVLDMGKQVPIMSLARDMIRLAGLRPGTDIAIEITGMRPGEKLYEELLTQDERVQSTKHKRIRVVQGHKVMDWPSVASMLRAFKQMVLEEDAQRGKQLLKRYVPTYQEPHYEIAASPRRRKTRPA
jgi:FlaA1/EpsC-like NDP-sugar epimerase